LTYELDLSACQIEDRGRFHSANTAVDNRVCQLVEPVPYIVRIGQRKRLVRELKRRAENRLAQHVEQLGDDLMIRNPDTDRALCCVLQPSRRLMRGTQNESEWPWGQRPQQAIRLVVDARIVGYLGQIAA